MTHNQPSISSNSIAGRPALILLALLLIFGTAWLSSNQIIQSFQARHSVLCHQYALTEFQTLQTVVDSVEAGEQSYLMFGRENLLFPMDKARSEMERSFAHLKDLSTLTAAEKTNLDKLHGVCRSWLNTGSLHSRSSDAESVSRILCQQIREEQSRVSFYSNKFEGTVQGVLVSICCLFTLAFLVLLVSVAILFNWSQEKRAILEKSRLEKLEQNLIRQIIAGAPIGITKLDRDLKITETNLAFALQAGAEEAEMLLSRSLRQVMGDAETAELLESRLLDCEQPFLLEGLKFNNGVLPAKYLNLTGWSLRDEENRVCGAVLLSAEVSERVRLMELRDDVFSTIAHDLKSPLHGMDRILDLFLAGSFGELESLQSSTLKKLKDCNSALIKLVSKLVELHRYEASPGLESEMIDLVDVIQESLKLVAPILDNKSLTMKVSLPTGLRLSADRIAIMRLVCNLLENAAKFTREKDTIDLTLQHNCDFAIFEISNDCDPISEDIRERMFQRFYQGVPSKYVASTGLGLYMCRRIAELHEGTITCLHPSDSRVTFRVTLPLSGGDADPRTVYGTITARRSLV